MYNVLVSRRGELDWGKLRTYMGFYTTERDLDERGKYKSELKLEMWFCEKVKVSGHTEIGLAAKQIRNPNVIMWRDKDERRDLPT